MASAPPASSPRAAGPAPAIHPAFALGGAVLAALGIAAFHSVARVYYDDFRVPQGYGMDFPLPQELAHLCLFFVFGLAVVVLLAAALLGTRVPAAAVAGGRAVSRRPLLFALGCAILLSGACLLVRASVLGDGVLSDDEYVYRFIAQTLRTGSLTAPSPVTDLEFFQEQFVVTTDKVRYGKYPIGFPLLLAAGQALHVERAVVPVLTGLLVLLMAWVGGKEFSPGVVALALGLFTLSPQVLITGASLLSQPASAVCLLGAVGCLLEWRRGAPRSLAWAAGAGVLLGFGAVIRPLPGVPFAAAALVAVALAPSWGGRRATGAHWLALLVPIGGAALTLLWVNFRQSGHPLVSGYHAVHAAEWGPNLLFHGTLARWAMSLVSSVLRLNFWLFGWPLSLVLCAFARRTPAALLFWLMVAAELAYRLIAPKAGIGTPGPIYLYEVVPLLCLLSADGLSHLLAIARRRLVGRSRIPGPEAIAATALAAIVVNVSLFLPFKLGDVARTGEGERVVFRAIREKGVHHALVFHRTVVPAWTGLSWAYFPPPNSPGLDDDVLFVLLQVGPEAVPANVGFWKRRFPDRQAWFFGWEQESGPFLLPLETYLATGAPTPSRSAGSARR